MDNVFTSFVPNTPPAWASSGGIAPNLIPTPPAAMPKPFAPGNAMASLSPFVKPQDVQQIIMQLSLDRPLPLHIPDREKYPEYQFRVINDTPQEIAAAMRAGWQPADYPELVKQFEGKVSGSTKEGKLTRPILMARHKQIGEAHAQLVRRKLYEQNQGLDPKNRVFRGGKNEPSVSEATFSGMGFTRLHVPGPVR